MTVDALVATRMKLSDGGAQPKMPGGRPQKMITNDSKAKGLQSILTENGLNCTTYLKDVYPSMMISMMRKQMLIISTCQGYYVMFFPKFHCEMNSNEHVWAQAKHYTCAHCNYSYAGLQRTVGPGLDSIDTHLIRKPVTTTGKVMYLEES